jgi:hypothetical protein
VSWLFMLLAIFEPPNSSQHDYYEQHPTYFIPITIVETIIVSMYMWETFMEIYHRAYDDTRSFKEKFTKNYKVIFKVLVSILFFLDLVVFHSVYPENIFRFARPFRPSKFAF